MEKLEITKQVWRDYPKDYKSIIEGTKYILKNNPETGGTELVPVKVV